MSNIAAALREEITRLARKELRTEVDRLRKSSTRYRSEIAALKRRAEELEKQVTRLSRNGSKKAIVTETAEAPAGIRFSARSLQAQRRRLGLSARQMAILLGVSEQTVYNWEAQKTKPRPKQLAAFVATRAMGRDDALAHIEALS